MAVTLLLAVALASAIVIWTCCAASGRLADENPHLIERPLGEE